MLEKLLELLLSAKSGVIAGVFLIGTTGALVTATVQNGVTTITITEASPSPSASASASATASPTASATASPTASPSSSSSASPLVVATPGACADVSADVQEVNSAFSKFHTDLMHRREGAKSGTASSIIDTADKSLKQIRQNAVEAIHAASVCKKTDDEDTKNDEDKNEDQDKDTESGDKGHAQGNFLVVLLGNLFGTNNTNTTNTASPSPTATTSASPTASPSNATTTLTGSDPKTLADNAVAAMQVVFDDAIKQLQTATATPKAHATRSPETHDRSGDHRSGGDD